MYKNELRHHGILGQKWGVRRFQNKDGSLTAAGRKRYDVDIDSAKERVKLAKQGVKAAYKDYKKSVSGFFVDKQSANLKLKKYKSQQDNLDWEKTKLGDEKAKAALNKAGDKKSKHRLKLEEMYRERGMSAEEAEVAAYKRARTEKILAAVGGTAIAATAAYVAYKHWDKNTDRLIKPGTTLQNISNNSNKGVEDAFFFSSNKLDNIKYRGMLGNQLEDRGAVYETKIGVQKSLKVASEKHAAETLSNMVKNNQVSTKELKERFKLWQDSGIGIEQEKVFGKAIQSLERGKIDKNVYDAFNITLPHITGMPEHNNLTKKFYDALTSKGYDAIMDLNDKKFSGYGSSKPMIAFNATGKAVVNNVRELGVDEIQKNSVVGAGAAYTKALLKATVPQIAGGVAISATVSSIKKSKKQKERDTVVSEYRKQHPDSKLSYNEIIDAYYKK